MLNKSYSAFDDMFNTFALNSNDYQKTKITAEQYDEFEQNWVIYVLKDFRYGQAFIDFFKLPNATPLFYFNDEKICRRWIRDNYLQK